MSDRKVSKTLKRALSLALAAVFLLLTPGLNALADAPSGSGAGSSATYDAQFVSERISNNYTKVSSGYTSAEYSGEALAFAASEAAGATTAEQRRR